MLHAQHVHNPSMQHVHYALFNTYQESFIPTFRLLNVTVCMHSVHAHSYIALHTHNNSESVKFCLDKNQEEYFSNFCKKINYLIFNLTLEYKNVC